MSELKQSFIENKLAMVCLVIIFILVCFGLLAPLLAPNNPTRVELINRLAQPSMDFPLGTDHLGRCILSRLIYGTRASLGTSLVVMAITMVISIVVGTISGYKGGLVDDLIMRLCDMILAFPSLVLSLVIIGMLGPGLRNLMIAMISVYWVRYSRIIRSMVLSVKESNYILAAKVSGSSDFKIIFYHILPNVMPQIVVLATIDLGKIILHISGFSFLGLGIQPPQPEWGIMLNDARDFMRSNFSLMVYPGLMILITTVSFNIIGDMLRDSMEKKSY